MAIGRVETWEDNGKIVQVKYPPTWDINGVVEFIGRAPAVDSHGRTGKVPFPIPVAILCTPEDKIRAEHCPDHLIKVAFAHWDVCLAAEIKRLQKPKIALPGVGAPRSIPLPLNGGFRKGN